MSAVDTTHECPEPSCRRRVPRHMFACGTHWRILPNYLKRPILDAYGRDRQAHALAMVAAIRWYNGPRTKLENVHVSRRGAR